MTANEDLIFAELAIKRSLLTPEQVDEILELKKKLGEMGLQESVSDLIVKKGMLSKKDADALLVRISPKGGRQQIEGYRLVERLGRGGMGSVYKAVQLSMGRPVALKVLKPSLTKNDQHTERLRREAQLVGKLRHPNIVQGLDFGVSNGFHYFAMEYVDGESVRDLVEKRGPMKEKEALRIVHQVALALEHAHQEGVVHRDVKPGNILVARDGAVKLADYGLAKGPLEDVELTVSGVTVGTPQYISPEQARGPSDVDIRTDLYSLGGTLYHMVTGRPPYEGETLAHLIQQVLYEAYAPPRSLRRDLSPSTEYLIEKLMARKPRHRYQNPRELLRDLEAIEQGRSIVPAGWQGDFEAFFLRRRYRRLVVAALLLVVLAGTASGVIVWRMRKIEREASETAAAKILTVIRNEEITAEGLDDRIARLEDLVGDYGGTKAAREAENEDLPLARARLEWARAFAEVRQEMRRKEESGLHADARAALGEFISRAERQPEEKVELALRSAREALRALEQRREEAVRDETAKKLEEFVHLNPEPALRKIRTFHDDLARRMYGPDEADRPALVPLRQVRDGLDRAISGVDRLTAEAGGLLELDAPRDYRQIRETIDDARQSFAAESGLLQTLANLPEGWRKNLESRFDRLETDAEKKNRAEAAQARAEADRLVEEEKSYEAAAKELSDLADRSLPSVEADLRRQSSIVKEQLQRLSLEARQAWEDFLPQYVRLLGRRNWNAARLAAAQLRADVVTHMPNPLSSEVQAADHILNTAEQVETDFLARIAELGELPDGLLFGGVHTGPISRIEVDGQTITYRTRDGRRESRDVSEVAADDLVRVSGVDPSRPEVSLAGAILRLAELTSRGGARRLRDRIDADIEARVTAAFADPVLLEFALSIREYVRELRERADQEVETLEGTVRDRWKAIEEHILFGRWQQAHDGIRTLLEDENFRETQWVKENRSTLESELEEAKRHLPSAGIRDLLKTRTVRVRGESVKRREVVERIFFDFEDPAQLANFSYTEGRIGIVEDESPILGPPSPDEPVGTLHMRTDRLLEFLAPDGNPESWPRYHPLVLESPYIYSKPMSIEFRIRWDRPVALVLSLSGTNVVVLSDDGRKTGGRGVHIWQGESYGDPDEVLPGKLRETWLARHPEALDGEARHHEYFQFAPAIWYRVRFAKGEKQATLSVDGVPVLTRDVEQYGPKTGEIAVLTWTPAEIDEVVIEGTIDPDWYHRRVVRGRKQ